MGTIGAVLALQMPEQVWQDEDGCASDTFRLICTTKCRYIVAIYFDDLLRHDPEKNTPTRNWLLANNPDTFLAPGQDNLEFVEFYNHAFDEDGNILGAVWDWDIPSSDWQIQAFSEHGLRKEEEGEIDYCEPFFDQEQNLGFGERALRDVFPEIDTLSKCLVIVEEGEVCEQFFDLTGDHVDIKRLDVDAVSGYVLYDGKPSDQNDGGTGKRTYQFFKHGVEQPISVRFELFPEAKREAEAKEARLQRIYEGLQEPENSFERTMLDINHLGPKAALEREMVRMKEEREARRKEWESDSR